MKKHILVVIFYLLIVILISCSDNTITDGIEKGVETSMAENIKETSTAEESEEKENKNIITIRSSGDVMATDIKGVLELSDLAVKARYIKETDVYALQNTGTPVAINEFEVLEVVKGEYTGDVITVECYGGLLPLNEYVEALGAESAKKAGYDFSEEESKNVYIELSNGTPKVEFTNKNEYLLMMSYDPDTDIYFVLCGGYGSPVIKDGKVYNAVEEKFVDMAKIKEAAAEK